MSLDHIRVAVTTYLISDNSGAEVAIECGQISAPVSFERAHIESTTASAIEVANVTTGQTDFRPMTADEVADYLRRQDEEEDE